MHVFMYACIQLFMYSCTKPSISATPLVVMAGPESPADSRTNSYFHSCNREVCELHSDIIYYTKSINLSNFFILLNKPAATCNLSKPQPKNTIKIASLAACYYETREVQILTVTTKITRKCQQSHYSCSSLLLHQLVCNHD